MLLQADVPRLYLGCFKRLFISACAVWLLIWLIYITLIHIDYGASAKSQSSWNISVLIQEAIYKLQAVVSSQKIERKQKMILLWTKMFRKSNWLPSTEMLQCAIKDCDVTSNRSLMTQSSAMVLHWRDIDVLDLPTCVPSENVQCPLWVLFNNEAPPHTPRHRLKKYQNKVHWTATYRRDSDLYASYGNILPAKGNSSAKQDYKPGRRLVCWLVSNCRTPSKRELYVKELKKHIEVDIYGKCGSKKCPHRLMEDCYDWLSLRCKFYLAFENSICKDYVTEKLFNALSSGMVPVVMGKNSNYEHLPERSYINTFDFPSPKELAEYLIIVGKDKELYMSYFWWRKWYDVESNPFKWFCDLCAKLHDTDIRGVSPHSNLTWWWYGQSGCMM